MIRWWRHFLEYVSNYKKSIILNYILFLILITILLLIDLLTKHFLFDINKKGIVIHSNWLFGIKSHDNPGLTFFPGEINIGLVTFFNVVILLACLIGIFFLRNYWIVIFVSFIFSGSLGNTIDRLAFHYVRDIVFLPWCNLGTFNFADMDVIIGSFGCVGSWTVIGVMNYYRNK